MEETCWVVFCKNKHTRHLKATALKLSKHSFQKIVHLHVFRHGNALDCKIMTVPELCNCFLQLHSNNAEFEFDCPNQGSSGEFLQAGTGPCAKQAHTYPECPAGAGASGRTRQTKQGVGSKPEKVVEIKKIK